MPAATALNVNTASALVLSTLADNLSPQAAQQLVQARGAEGYRQLSDFTGQPALAGLGVQASGLALGSQYTVITHGDVAVAAVVEPAAEEVAAEAAAAEPGAEGAAAEGAAAADVKAAPAADAAAPAADGAAGKAPAKAPAKK